MSIKDARWITTSQVPNIYSAISATNAIDELILDNVHFETDTVSYNIDAKIGKLNASQVRGIVAAPNYNENWVDLSKVISYVIIGGMQNDYLRLKMNEILENSKYIKGKTMAGTEIQLLGVYTDDVTQIGQGGFDAKWHFDATEFNDAKLLQHPKILMQHGRYIQFTDDIGTARDGIGMQGKDLHVGKGADRLILDNGTIISYGGHEPLTNDAFDFGSDAKRWARIRGTDLVANSFKDQNSNQVVGIRQSAIPDIAVTGTATDGDARAKINAILSMLRAHGLIAS